MSTASDAAAAERLRHSKPPITDKFTYLTIIEKSLSPELLPTLHELLLGDVQLTNDIGWDLVEMLIQMAGSESCLETIARLGNPREVILKVVQVMESLSEEDEDEDAYGKSTEIGSNKAFVTLCGMLEILHQRLTVQRPSRFVHTSLQSVLKSYDPRHAESTEAVISLARSLSGQVRPPLPTRLSQPRLETTFQEYDPAQSASDPEADQLQRLASNEIDLTKRLIQSFLTFILEAYANAHNMEWASRLIEYTHPLRIVPGRPTVTQLFSTRSQLRARDALMGQLAAICKDAGICEWTLDSRGDLCSGESDFLGEYSRDPFDIKLSSAGLVCKLAYQAFASDIFEANHPQPMIHMFPDLFKLLKHFLGESDPQARVISNPGTAEAMVVLAVWLEGRKLVAAGTDNNLSLKPNFMEYLHLLTLMSLFHPNVRVRDAATVTAGLVFHADPDEEDRLLILQDLLGNCKFPSLKACAVTWLREDIVQAAGTNAQSRFNSAVCLEVLHDLLFPSLIHLNQTTTSLLIDYWAHNAPFLLQTANFAFFLYAGNKYRALAPANMAVAIEHRFVEPLLQVARHLLVELREDNFEAQESLWGGLMQLEILIDVLSRLSLHPMKDEPSNER